MLYKVFREFTLKLRLITLYSKDSNPVESRPGRTKYRKTKGFMESVRFLSLVLPAITLAVIPLFAQAGFFSFLQSAKAEESIPEVSMNSQNSPVLLAFVSPDPRATIEEPEVLYEGEEALISSLGVLGSIQGEYYSMNGKEESLYVVRPGDTISEIADRFHINVQTIRSRNDIGVKEYLQAGQELKIPPQDGVYYKVVKGDTIAGVAKKFSGKVDTITSFNGLEDKALVIGNEIFIPGGIIPVVIIKQPSKPITTPSKITIITNTTDFAGWTWPVVGGVVTQGYGNTHFAKRSKYYKADFHGGVDIGAPKGSNILAAKEGIVTISKIGYNGGYGNYVELEHPDGTKTRYGHATKLLVKVGQSVAEGQVIATVGRTGRATGNHLHFEIRDTDGTQMENNPFYVAYKNY